MNYKKLFWPILVIVAIGVTYKVTMLNSELPLRWRIQHAHDMRTGTRLREPGYNAHSYVLPKDVKTFFLTANSFEVVEHEVISRESNAHFATERTRSKKNSVTNLRERSVLMQAIEAGVREAKPRRVPMHFMGDYYINAKKGKQALTIEISFDGYDIKMQRFSNNPSLGVYTHEFFDPTRHLQLFRRLARKQKATPKLRS